MLFKAKTKALHLNPLHKHLAPDKTAKACPEQSRRAAAPPLTPEDARQAVGHWLLDNGLPHLHAFAASAASAAGETGATFYVAVQDDRRGPLDDPVAGTLLYHVETQSIAGFGGAFLPKAFPLYDHKAPVRSGYEARRSAFCAAD